MSLSGYAYWFKNEPPHGKTNKITVRPAKTQISLGIRPVWSESSLCVQWVAKDLHELSLCRKRRLWSDWADAQADLSLRWADTQFVGFVMSRLKFLPVCSAVSLGRRFLKVLVTPASEITILAGMSVSRPFLVTLTPVVNEQFDI